MVGTDGRARDATVRHGSPGRGVDVGVAGRVDVGIAGRTVAGVLGAWAATWAVNRSLVRVRGDSMAPTLVDGDVVLTRPLLGTPRRGDVVVLRDPRVPDDRVHVKRVVGLPGEQVRVDRGRLLVDGVRQLEPYAAGRGPDGGLAVPGGHVVVLGDARGASTDSREYGPVPLESLDRVVVARVTPGPALLRERPVPLGVAPPHAA